MARCQAILAAPFPLDVFTLELFITDQFAQSVVSIATSSCLFPFVVDLSCGHDLATLEQVKNELICGFAELAAGPLLGSLFLAHFSLCLLLADRSLGAT